VPIGASDELSGRVQIATIRAGEAEHGADEQLPPEHGLREMSDARLARLVDHDVLPVLRRDSHWDGIHVHPRDRGPLGGSGELQDLAILAVDPN